MSSIEEIKEDIISILKPINDGSLIGFWLNPFDDTAMILINADIEGELEAADDVICDVLKDNLKDVCPVFCRFAGNEDLETEDYQDIGGKNLWVALK